jgi:Predicted membrane protein
VVMPVAFALGFMGVDVLDFAAGDAAMPQLGAALFCGSLGLVAGLPLLRPWRGGGKACAVALALAAVVVGLLAVLYAKGVFEDLEWILPLCMVITAFVFTAIIKAPSVAARAVLDAVDGLALYLRTAETPRMEQLSGPDAAPEDTPAVFRSMLPYALVLGLEETWCNRFADQLAAGAAEGYVDAALVSDGWGDFSQSFGGAVSAASSSAGSASSDSAFGSSGGGGAGSGSGGGGGGGL